jgi:AraC family transcriptional regulator of adaptative response/methylated-DNA-[protein]-cysteine methyltransferase
MTQTRRLHAVADPLEAARVAIAREPEREPKLAELARLAGLSPGHLQRRFRARFGVSPKDYARALRVQRLKAELRQGSDVTEAIYAAGFGSASRVYEHAAQLIGMTPGSYQRGARGIAIRYTIVERALGKLLVAVTDRGLCAVMPGDDEAALARALATEFPHAECLRVDDGADEWIDAALARVDAQLDGARDATGPIPADVQATAFQWQVWQALTRIPRGETRSYAAIARAIGRPTATRAVARACASNKLAFVVPCHRVVREDGSLGGYRWGLPRKRAALARERAATTTAAPPAMAPSKRHKPALQSAASAR